MRYDERGKRGVVATRLAPHTTSARFLSWNLRLLQDTSQSFDVFGAKYPCIPQRLCLTWRARFIAPSPLSDRRIGPVPVQTRPSAPGPCLVELHDGAIRAQRYVPGDRNRRRVVGAAGGSVRLSALGAEPDHA